MTADFFFPFHLWISTLKWQYHPAWKNLLGQADIKGMQSHVNTLLIREISARIEGDRSVSVGGGSWISDIFPEEQPVPS